MEDPRAPTTLDVELDVMGQQPLMRIYTQICFCFGHPESVPDITIVDALTKGLERLSASFPWVTGQVVAEGACEGNAGIYKIKPLEEIPRLTVKDLRQDETAPTMDDLRRAKFPMSMLDEDVIAPRRTLPGGPGYSPTDPEPVLLLQANFIQGGLILTVNAQHATMDMTGQGEIIRLFSKACRGEEFTPEEISEQKLPRNTIVTLLEDTWQPTSELDNQIIKPLPVTADGSIAPPPQPPAAKWAYFSFSSDSLAELKSIADKSKDPKTAFISTDDALSSFIWKAVSRIRLQRLEPDTESMFSRAVDVRPQVGAPKGYPGLLQNMTYNRLTLQEVAEKPLGEIASLLRGQLSPKDLEYRTRALITVMSRTTDKSGFNVTATVNPSSGCMLSSWVKVAYCNNLDFNLGLGKPERVRRPQFTPFESLMYLMPKSLDGEISAAVSLRVQDMQLLMEDDEFTKYGVYIG